MHIKLDSITLNVIDEGSGYPVVFLHGTGANFRIWEHQIDAFRDDYRCIVPDLRGAGQSQAGDKPYTIGLFAEDIAALCARLGVTQAHMVGQSSGGWFVQALAMDYPELVKSVVLVGTGCYADPATRPLHPMYDEVSARGMGAVPELIIDLVYPASFQQRRPDLVSRFIRDLVSCDPEDIVRKLKMTDKLDLRDRLPKIQAPALVMAGQHDQVWPPESSRLIASLLPHASCVIYPDSGHQPFYEQPELFNATLREFFEKHSA